MEQLTGAATFITRSAPSPADRLAGDRVDRRQRRNLMAGQDPPDGGGDQPELAGQEHRTAVALAAKLEDLGLELGAGALRGGVRTRRAVFEPGQPLGFVAVDPLRDGAARDPAAWR
jgi:hypothetical protein